MDKQLHKIEKFRRYIIKEIDGLTTEQLNGIPESFNNNIIWNLAHLIAASQMIFYKRAGFDVTIDEKYITPFLTSTRPDKFLNAGDVMRIKELAISTIDAMNSDLKAKDFSKYIKSENIEKIYDLEVLSIEDALAFLLYHEGYHAAKIITLKQSLLSNKQN